MYLSNIYVQYVQCQRTFYEFCNQKATCTLHYEICLKMSSSIRNVTYEVMFCVCLYSCL
jgi:hypothetical protein